MNTPKKGKVTLPCRIDLRYPITRRLRQLIVLSPPDILAIVRNPRPAIAQISSSFSFVALSPRCVTNHVCQPDGFGASLKAVSGTALFGGSSSY
ncbi:unnamed protein product [Heligmosomoides polygyrus]|uniref:Uncharacterized protein n=1 Tax=Heligmosomoides polygyrus TaxID=6339 RepID=A0A183FI21_HELPZ|nr:unnamed protein product [Heligmosomoides polygyrus]